MTLWDWSIAIWKRPSVEAACLSLQDHHGQCVPLLLWSLWLADAGRGADDAAMDRAVALCRSMTADVIEPLRAARRGAGPDDKKALLARELDAEQDLIDRLDAILTDGHPEHGGATQWFVTLSERWGRPLDRVAFEPLMVAIRQAEGSRAA